MRLYLRSVLIFLTHPLEKWVENAKRNSRTTEKGLQTSTINKNFIYLFDIYMYVYHPLHPISV